MTARLPTSYAPHVVWSSLSALVGVSLYVNTLDNPFVYDDLRTVVDNGSIVSLHDVASIVMHDATRPLTNFSLALDRSAWGSSPWGFHLTNVVLHAITVMLVYWFAKALWEDTLRDGGSNKRAVIAGAVSALLFAAHPINTEAVAYVSSRSDLLCTALVVTAFLTARRWLIGRGWVWLVATWVLWSAATLTKETAVVFPFVLVLYSYLSTSTGRSRAAGTGTRPRVRILVGPMFLGMIAAIVVRLQVWIRLEQGRLDAEVAAFSSIAQYFWQYVRFVVIPGRQAIFHAPHSPPDGWYTSSTLLISTLVVAGLLWRARRKAPAAVVGATWFVLLLMPAAVFNVFDDRSGIAEHRVYLPLVGAFAGVGALAADSVTILGRLRTVRLLGPLAFASVVLALGGRTMVRNLVWSDPVALWQEAVDLAPAEPLPIAALGEALHAAGRHEEAAQAFRRSLVSRPDDDGTVLNLVVCLCELGREDEAQAVISDTARSRPASAVVTVGRGVVAALGGQVDEARTFFLKAVESDPKNIMARQWLAVLAQDADNRPEALHRCYELQRLMPGSLTTDACIERFGNAK